MGRTSLPHFSYWSIKWYGVMGRLILTKAWRLPPQCRQRSVHCLGDTNTCGNCNAVQQATSEFHLKIKGVRGNSPTVDTSFLKLLVLC